MFASKTDRRSFLLRGALGAIGLGAAYKCLGEKTLPAAARSECVVFPTIDGDPGDTSPNSRFSRMAGAKWTCDRKNHIMQYQRAVERLLMLFENLHMRGKVTWLLNERDVGWSRSYRSLLRNMVRDGYEIGLHTHVGTVFQASGLENLRSLDEKYEVIKRSKENLEQCIGKACISHRYGCFYQNKELYSIVKRLGIRILSDVVPGVFVRDLEGHILDNESVPVNVSPWRHNEDNWLEVGSNQGCFLQIPVSAAGLEGDELLEGRQPQQIQGRPLKNITPLNRLAEKAATHSIKCLCWDIHPHEIQTIDGGIDPKKVSSLRDSLEKIESSLHPKCVTLAEYRTTFGE